MEPIQAAEGLIAQFPDGVSQPEEFRGQVTVYVERDMLVPALKFLRDTAGYEFDLLRDLTAIDYMGKRPVRFEVVYFIFSVKHRHALRVKCRVHESDCRVPTVTGIWIGADWHERECYDLFGIRFDGHHDHRRILLPDDWEGHPLRKDYPVTGYEFAKDWSGYRDLIAESERLKEFGWNN